MPSSPVAEAPTLSPEAQADTASNKAESRPEGSPAPQESEAQETKPSGETKGSSSHSDSHSEGEYSGSDTSEHRDPKTGDEAQPPLPNEPVPGDDNTAPPLPNEPLPSDSAAPPLPAEPVPEPEDDGWEYHWNPNDQSYWFYNRFTGVWQKENPRVPTDATAVPQAATTPAATAIAATPTVAADGTVLSNPASVAGGYNPAIHGDYDENAWYAQALRAQQASAATSATGDEYATAALFNRHTGRWQTADQGPERHSDEAKSRRQMRAFFDVDAAANMHDGRSLKAERAGIKPSRAELKAFKEKRRAKKEEKRRAWLRD